MKQYVEVRLLPDAELPPPVLMNAVFGKLHRALVAAKRNDIGVSFPDAGKDLGTILRLHGQREALTRLMDGKWIRGMADYVEVSSVMDAPDNCTYRIVKRVQTKSSAERLYRRSVRKGWLSPEEAEKKVAETAEQRLKCPHVQLKSGSSGQVFRLFIHQGDVSDAPREGSFSTYGLSQNGTVPWF